MEILFVKTTLTYIIIAFIVIFIGLILYMFIKKN